MLLLIVTSIIATATIVALALFYTAWRHRYVRRMEMVPAIMGAVFGLIGTLFSILIAFSIIVVWGSYVGAASTSAEEANALGNLESMSRGFSVPVRRQVQEAVRSYAKLVIAEEWPKMAEGETSERADALLIELWHIYTDIAPAERSHPVYSQSLARLNEVTTNRRLRLLTIDDRVPPILWVLLTVVGLLLLMLSFQFDIAAPWTHAVIVGVIAILVSLPLLLVAALDNPYGGLMAIEPEPFQLVLDNLQQLEM